MDDLTGRQLGAYQIISRLGAGGMATVFQAYQPKMERYVALKVLRREFSRNPEFVGRFSQEARVIAQLEHPHILPIYDYGEADGYTYMAMRLVKGGSLSDRLKKHGKMDLPAILRIITQVGGALDYAHKRNVIHRDFKPGNVLIDEFGNCLLTDFGIAKLIEATSHLTATGGILGTPFYISPEQGAGEQIDHRSDIYALGVVLYHMVVGEVPYKADTPMAVVFKHIHDPLPLPSRKVPGLPEPIERVILKALAKNPEDRYASAGGLVDALQAAMEPVSFDRPEPQVAIPGPVPDPIAEGPPHEPQRLSSPPNDRPKPGPSESEKPDAQKLLRAKNVKRMTPARWGYTVIALLVIAGVATAVWVTTQSKAPTKTSLVVHTDPGGADVYVDDAHVGTSPVTLEKLNPGAHRVRILKNGYQAFEKELELHAGDPQVLRAELLNEPNGRLLVRSDPEEVEVPIDDQAREATPITLDDMPRDNRKPSFQKQGYEKKSLTVTRKEGDEQTIDVQLQPVVDSGTPKTLANSLGMAFVHIQPGTFFMGSPSGEPGRQARERRHEVTLTKGFYIQTTEVTVGQWRAFVRATNYRSEAETGGGAWFHRGKKWLQKAGRTWDNPGFSQTENNPVTCVSWNDVQKFIQWLRQKERHAYRLPTESEWEYACRAGSQTAFSNGAMVEHQCGPDPHLNVMGWYCGNSNRKSSPVAQKKPNPYGLFDMHGNVWEWCQDWYAEYPSGPVADPRGPSRGGAKVRRGGSWGSDAWACRSACRGKFRPDRATRGIGFRLAMDPPPAK